MNFVPSVDGTGVLVVVDDDLLEKVGIVDVDSVEVVIVDVVDDGINGVVVGEGDEFV